MAGKVVERQRRVLAALTALMIALIVPMPIHPALANATHPGTDFGSPFEKPSARCHSDSGGRPESTRMPLSLCDLIAPRPHHPEAAGIQICSACEANRLMFQRPLFTGLSMLDRAPQAEARTSDPDPASSPEPAQNPDPGNLSDFRAVLETPLPREHVPWAFVGNGGRGVKTWLSDVHVLEINPLWLNFTCFDSMDLSMTDRPPGPGQREPQEWRSTFTVGLSTDWHLTRATAVHAGYRFYNNPIPDTIPAGAFPNASQHVMAVGLSVRDGRHSLSMIYGLDVLEASGTGEITSVRHGDNIDPLAHLVAMTYRISF